MISLLDLFVPVFKCQPLNVADEQQIVIHAPLRFLLQTMRAPENESAEVRITGRQASLETGA